MILKILDVKTEERSMSCFLETEDWQLNQKIEDLYF